MQPVFEDKNGAYRGVKPEFLARFNPLESNPNFDVFNAKDGHNRLIMAKCSRLPDDDDTAAGRCGLNFHRAKPDYEQARRYLKGLPGTLEDARLLNDLAFAAASREEYALKAAVWDKFYSYVWGREPQTLWITPHSGDVTRAPDAVIPYPKLEQDNYVAGAAARCALKNSQKPRQRIMMSIHSHNWLGAVLDLGGFGIIVNQQLDELTKIIEAKYHRRVQTLAARCKQDFNNRINQWLNHIQRTRGTLDPAELGEKYRLDRSIIGNITRSLGLYGIEIKTFNLAGFKAAATKLDKAELKTTSVSCLFSGEYIGRLLGLKEKINAGLMSSALQVECVKFYLKNAPDLAADMILDVKKELFD